MIAGLEPLEGAREFLDALRSITQVVILSDTFEQFGAPLMRHLGMPTLLCHRLVVEDDRIIDYALRMKDQKRHAVEAFRSLNFRVVAAGDSYNDSAMLGAADAGFWFHAPPNIRGRVPAVPGDGLVRRAAHAGQRRTRLTALRRVRRNLGRMPEIKRYRHGVPNWVDVSTRDIAATVEFYSTLFGWEAFDLGEDAGNYHMLRKGGLDVAGLGPAQRISRPRGPRTSRSTTSTPPRERRSPAGGTSMMPVMDVFEAGRMTFVSDPTGAAVGLWQGKNTIGSKIVNEPATARVARAR